MSSNSNHFPNCFYRVNVKGLFVRGGKVMLLKEAPEKSGMWELPGGGVEFGEKMHDALRREIEEETGLKVKSISRNSVYVWPWKHENARNMEWYYSLVVAFRIELESLDFKATESCEEIGFFSKEELGTIELCGQTNGLLDVFSPGDFI